MTLPVWPQFALDLGTHHQVRRIFEIPISKHWLFDRLRDLGLHREQYQSDESWLRFIYEQRSLVLQLCRTNLALLQYNPEALKYYGPDLNKIIHACELHSQDLIGKTLSDLRVSITYD